MIAMRRKLRDNPDVNAIEAFELLFETEPSVRQVDQAHNYGGLNDPRTISSIPDQVQWRQQQLWSMYPGLIVPLDMIANSIMLSEFKESHVSPHGNQWLYNCLGGIENWRVLQIFSHPPAHPVIEIYRELFLRDPDPEGLAFWMSIFDGGGWTKNQIREKFLESDEALMGQDSHQD